MVSNTTLAVAALAGAEAVGVTDIVGGGSGGGRGNSGNAAGGIGQALARQLANLEGRLSAIQEAGQTAGSPPLNIELPDISSGQNTIPQIPRVNIPQIPQVPQTSTPRRGGGRKSGPVMAPKPTGRPPTGNPKAGIQLGDVPGLVSAGAKGTGSTLDKAGNFAKRNPIFATATASGAASPIPGDIVATSLVGGLAEIGTDYATGGNPLGTGASLSGTVESAQDVADKAGDIVKTFEQDASQLDSGFGRKDTGPLLGGGYGSNQTEAEQAASSVSAIPSGSGGGSDGENTPSGTPSFSLGGSGGGSKPSSGGNNTSTGGGGSNPMTPGGSASGDGGNIGKAISDAIGSISPF